MKSISDSLRLFAWLFICVGMAFGMIIFAIIYGAASFLMRKLAWRSASISIPNIKLYKKKLAI